MLQSCWDTYKRVMKLGDVSLLHKCIRWLAVHYCQSIEFIKYFVSYFGTLIFRE